MNRPLKKIYLTVHHVLLVLAGGSLLLMGCNDYLDQPSSSRLAIPSSMDDCQALLDDYSRMNAGYPADGEASADNYYLNTANFEYLTTSERDIYTWAPRANPSYHQWLYPYSVVYNANLVLQTLENMEVSPNEKDRHDHLTGSALFFRAYAHYELMRLFAPPYVAGSDNSAPAIPVRVSPDLDVHPMRETVAGVYRAVLADLESAAMLLPVASTIASRPSRTAALAFLARVYLTMSNYPAADRAAAEALASNADLVDYNDLDTDAAIPFSRFNPEVLFHSAMQPGGHLSPYSASVDTVLYDMYPPDDLRRALFFTLNFDGSHAFKGNYNGTQDAVLFTGLTTAELYLIRAECLVRQGQVTEGIRQLSILLQCRWKNRAYTPPVNPTQVEAMELVLNERRKELVFRGQRWSDLRRLNQDADYAVTLHRQVNNTVYSLPPLDKRYVLLFPEEVMQTTEDLKQNER